MHHKGIYTYAATATVAIALAGCSSGSASSTRTASSAAATSTASAGSSASSTDSVTALAKQVTPPPTVGKPAWGHPQQAVAASGSTIVTSNNSNDGPSTTLTGLSATDGKTVWTLNLTSPPGGKMAHPAPPEIVQIASSLAVKWTGTTKASGLGAGKPMTQVAVFSTLTGKQQGSTFTAPDGTTKEMQANGGTAFLGDTVIYPDGTTAPMPAQPGDTQWASFTGTTGSTGLVSSLTKTTELATWTTAGHTYFQVARTGLTGKVGARMTCDGFDPADDTGAPATSPSGDWTSWGSALINTKTSTIRCLTKVANSISIETVGDDGSVYGLGNGRRFYLAADSMTPTVLPQGISSSPQPIAGGAYLSASGVTVFYRK